MTTTMGRTASAGHSAKSPLIEKLNVFTAFGLGIILAVVFYVLAAKLIPEDTDAMLIHTKHDQIILLAMIGWFIGFMVGIGALIGPFRWLLGKDLSHDENMFYAGKDLGTLATHKVPELRRQVGTVFQDFRLLPNKTITENVAFALHVLGYSQKEINREVPEVLELVGLEDKGDRLPSEISGGEQQRVAIARAYVSRPPILIADEPTGNLDPATSVGIMKLLDRINREGTTVLMATHDAGIVDQMRKRVIELDLGHVIRDQVRGVYGYTG